MERRSSIEFAYKIEINEANDAGADVLGHIAKIILRGHAWACVGETIGALEIGATI